MRNVNEIVQDIDYCIENLNYLSGINTKWKAELSGIDPVNRPQGYANHIEALRQQEVAFESETSRLKSLKAEQWLASTGIRDKAGLEQLRETLKSVSAAITKELKRIQEIEDHAKEASGLF